MTLTMQRFRKLWPTVAACTLLALAPAAGDEDRGQDWTATQLFSVLKQEIYILRGTTPGQQMAPEGRAFVSVTGTFVRQNLSTEGVSENEISVEYSWSTASGDRRTSVEELFAVTLRNLESGCAYHTILAAVVSTQQAFLIESGEGYELVREDAGQPVVLRPEQESTSLCLAFLVNPQDGAHSWRLRFGDGEFPLPPPEGTPGQS